MDVKKKGHAEVGGAREGRGEMTGRGGLES
jgi:hypothetical protein